jgi:tRNA modification GTPase
MTSSDTIAAISSAVGVGARMIVRVSGPDARTIAQSLNAPAPLESGTFVHHSLRFCDLSVPARIYFFVSPRSYTGEDLVEFHLPGNPVLAKMLLEELYRLGARPAEPGEFTARAYFNGRMDLTSAEGVAATIAANNEQELSAARKLLSGELARRLAPIMDSLTNTLALLEVGIDFSEEDVSFISWADVRAKTIEADESLGGLLSESARFERLAHEPQVVLVGRPNAGKSTLLNALAGRQRAVVSPVAGTTRDVLSAEVMLARGRVHVLDIAGIDEALAEDEIESKMRQHALRAVAAADVLVLVQDSIDPLPALKLPREPDLVVQTKIDLAQGNSISPSPCIPAQGRVRVFVPPGGRGSRRAEASFEPCGSAGVSPSPGKARPHPTPLPEYRERKKDWAAVLVGALTGVGMDHLKSRLDVLCFGPTSAGSTLALNLRHVRAIEEARAALSRVREELQSPTIELLAIELREALESLGGILGRVTPDDLLGRIFSGFCIGK